MCDADDLVVRQGDGLHRLAENIPRGRAGAAHHVHVEMGIYRFGALVRPVEFGYQPLDSQARAHLPRRDEPRTRLQVLADDLLFLKHPALADLHEVLREHVVVELVHLLLPACRPRDSRISRKVIEWLRVPVRVKADAAHKPLRSLRNRLGYGIRPAGRVLPYHDRHGACVKRVADLLDHRRLCPQYRLR